MKPAVSALMILMLSSCSILRWNKFEMINETKHDLKDIQISFADASAQRQSLDPGESFSFHPSPKSDGGVIIAYVGNGEKIRREVGYVAPPLSLRCKFQITDNGIRGNCS